MLLSDEYKEDDCLEKYAKLIDLSNCRQDKYDKLDVNMSLEILYDKLCKTNINLIISEIKNKNYRLVVKEVYKYIKSIEFECLSNNVYYIKIPTLFNKIIFHVSSLNKDDDSEIHYFTVYMKNNKTYIMFYGINLNLDKDIIFKVSRMTYINNEIEIYFNFMNWKINEKYLLE